MDNVRTIYFVVILGDTTAASSDATNLSSLHYDNKCSFPKVIRNTNNAFKHRYVLVGYIL